jgi:hypothetical protein
VNQNRPVILFHSFGDVCIADSFPYDVTDLMIKKYNGDTVKLGYAELGLCITWSTTLYILQYQLIPHGHVFFCLA